MVILLLKANPHHDARGRFARAPETGGSGTPSGVPVARLTGNELVGDDAPALRASARAYASQHFLRGRDRRGEPLPLLIQNRATGRVIGLRNVEKPTNQAWLLDQYRAVPALPDMLRDAIPVATEADKYGRAKIVAVHILAAPVEIAGRQYAARIVVREFRNGQSFYEHELSELVADGRPPAAQGVSAESVSATAPHGLSKPWEATTGGTVDVADLLAIIKPRHDLLSKALAAGERWITVKAPGHDKGQPVLIKPAPDGAYKVIGGAGGKLNHLKLTGVRSEADYKEEARSKQASRRDEKKRQRDCDRRPAGR